MKKFVNWFFNEEPKWYSMVAFCSVLLLLFALLITAVFLNLWQLPAASILAVVVYSWYRVVKDFIEYRRFP